MFVSPIKWLEERKRQGVVQDLLCYNDEYQPPRQKGNGGCSKPTPPYHLPQPPNWRNLGEDKQ